MTFEVLFVCVGNISRSPLAERLLVHRLTDLVGERAREVTVSSAGIRAATGLPMEAPTERELVRLGGSPERFASRPLRSAEVRAADLILTATLDIRGRVLEEVPTSLRRIFTIREFAALLPQVTVTTGPSALTRLVEGAVRLRSSTAIADCDVVDPYRRSAAVHRQAADVIDGAVTVMAQRFAQALG